MKRVRTGWLLWLVMTANCIPFTNLISINRPTRDQSRTNHVTSPFPNRRGLLENRSLVLFDRIIQSCNLSVQLGDVWTTHLFKFCCCNNELWPKSFSNNFFVLKQPFYRVIGACILLNYNRKYNCKCNVYKINIRLFRNIQLNWYSI